jgi:hypothetical protein
VSHAGSCFACPSGTLLCGNQCCELAPLCTPPYVTPCNLQGGGRCCLAAERCVNGVCLIV